ncbi:hypothetical protein [Brachyspira pilosicoli]|uniref:hypothetical protein n=1 Tax=Brachyspira pilosicoli TaxID=52584 RepID=UPI00300688F9
MKKVILSQNTKIAVFYDTLDNPEIENLVENSFGSITKGIINKEEKLFVKAGQYKISSSVKENKYISVPKNYWLIIDGMFVGNKKIMIEKIKLISQEKFYDNYEIIANEPNLFSQTEDTEDDEQSIKRKKIQNKHIENLGMNTDLSNVEVTETENGTPVIKIDLDKKKNKKA